MCCFIAKSTNT